MNVDFGNNRVRDIKQAFQQNNRLYVETRTDVRTDSRTSILLRIINILKRLFGMHIEQNTEPSDDIQQNPVLSCYLLNVMNFYIQQQNYKEVL